MSPIRSVSCHELGERSISCYPPVIKHVLQFGSHHEIWWSRALQRLFSCRRHIHIVASTVMLRAIPTTSRQSPYRAQTEIMVSSPLWKCLVTPNVPLLACLAPFPGLGMALSGRSASRTSHCLPLMQICCPLQSRLVEQVSCCQDLLPEELNSWGWTRPQKLTGSHNGVLLVMGRMSKRAMIIVAI